MFRLFVIFIFCISFMNANFEGVYVAEDKGKKNLVEIYKVGGVFYGFGFASLDGTVRRS